MKASKRECSEAEPRQPPQRRRRVQFAEEPQIHEAASAEKASPEKFSTRESSPSAPHEQQLLSGEADGQAEVDLLESRFTKETVEDLRRRKRALAAGVDRLGLGVRPADFDVSDSAAAADAAGEADPDEADAGEVPLEPFNMRKEMQEGAFDEGGTYIWRKSNPEEVRDPWLDSLGGAAATVSDAVKQRYAAEAENAPAPEVSVNVVESLRTILQVLNPAETPSRALRRLAEGGPSRVPSIGTPSGAPTGSPKGKGKKSRILPALAAAAEREAAAAAAAAQGNGEKRENLNAADKQKTFDSLTEICTALLATGRNVYFLTKEQLEEMLKKEASADLVGQSASDGAWPSTRASTQEGRYEAPAVLWQFRWTQNPHDKEVHGPYDSSTFLSWTEQNFISDSNPVEVRRVSAANDPLDGVWLAWRSVDFRSDEQQQRQLDLQEETEALWEAEEDARLAREARGNQSDDDDDRV
ncbi:hypothetical protein Esti_003809 [Eimeria stiedai]